MRKLVGRNFGKIRKEKGFTQERFAEASGFTQQYISATWSEAAGTRR
jgi:transcriptional regulator with XRE-family HTH domain